MRHAWVRATRLARRLQRAALPHSLAICGVMSVRPQLACVANTTGGIEFREGGPRVDGAYPLPHHTHIQLHLLVMLVMGAGDRARPMVSSPALSGWAKRRWSISLLVMLVILLLS